MSEERIIRRILVALDASPHSLAALEAAADLAANLSAELVGLFVEDINLLRYAELPFAQEVGHYSAQRRQMDSRLMERQMRAQARMARQAFVQVAEKADIKWSFRVTRGSIPAELRSATMETDLIILGRSGWANFRRLGSTTRAIFTQGPERTLVLRRGVQLGVSVFVLLDRSPQAKRAFTLAAQLAVERKGQLTALLIAESEVRALELQTTAMEWLEKKRLVVSFHWLLEADAATICTIVQSQAGGVLVVPKESPHVTDETLLHILSDINCPVLLVRHPADRPHPR